MPGKAVSALLIATLAGGSFMLGRWWQPSSKRGDKPRHGGKAKKEAPPAVASAGAKERIAALVKSDPEIAKFARDNPDLVAKAMKDPGSLASDPKFLMWAATHGAQVAELQKAARAGAPVLALPAGPAAKA